MIPEGHSVVAIYDCVVLALSIAALKLNLRFRALRIVAVLQQLSVDSEVGRVASENLVCNYYNRRARYQTCWRR
jgi:hypothetical protein